MQWINCNAFLNEVEKILYVQTEKRFWFSHLNELN